MSILRCAASTPCVPAVARWPVTSVPTDMFFGQSFRVIRAWVGGCCGPLQQPLSRGRCDDARCWIHFSRRTTRRRRGRLEVDLVLLAATGGCNLRTLMDEHTLEKPRIARQL